VVADTVQNSSVQNGTVKMVRSKWYEFMVRARVRISVGGLVTVTVRIRVLTIVSSYHFDPVLFYLRTILSQNR